MNFRQTFWLKIWVFISILFLSSCDINNEYTSYHNDKNNYVLEEKNYQKEIDTFSFDSIKEIKDIQIYPTPDTEFLDNLTKKIDSAKEKVYVEMYIFTEKRLKKAIIDAKKRGLDIKILLEKNVYKAPYLNKPFYEDFQKNWINLRYSKFENYSLNHTKLMIVDDEAIVSTWNYSYSTFKYNREFFLVIQNKEIYDVLKYIFLMDFDGKKTRIYQDNLVLSPFYSRNKMEYLIENAKDSIKIHAHNFNDENIKNLLIKKSKTIKIEIIFPSLEKIDSNKEIIYEFNKNNIKTYTISKPIIHAKTILIDDKYLYLWSINFSKNSMDENREIWIVLKDEKIIKKYIETFEKDKK